MPAESASEAWRDRYDSWKLATPWDDLPEDTTDADDGDHADHRYDTLAERDDDS